MRRINFPLLFSIGFLTVIIAGMFGPAKKSSNADFFKESENSSDSNDRDNGKRFRVSASKPSSIKIYLDQARNTLLDVNSKGLVNDSLEFLRSERIEDDPTFEMAVMPELKSLVLDGLIKRFSRADWLFWKESLVPTSYSDEKITNTTNYYKQHRTAARIYVDQIKVKNITLGKYLESAALLFSALYLSTDQGKVFSVEEELYSLSSSAHSIFRTRTAHGISPRSNLDLEITTDPPFIFWLESLRASFIILFCKREKKQVETQFELLSSIQNTQFNEALIDAYSNLYKISSTSISPRFREEIRLKYNDPNRERELSARSKTYRDSFLNFNESLFTDAISNKDIGKAKGIVLSLSAVFPQDTVINTFEERIEALKNEIKDRKIEESISNKQNTEKTNYKGILPDSIFGDKVSFKSSNLTNIIERLGLILIGLMFLALLLYKGLPKIIEYFPRILSYLNFSKTKIMKNKDSENISVVTDEDKLEDVLQASISSPNSGQVRSIKEGIQLREKKRAVG